MAIVRNCRLFSVKHLLNDDNNNNKKNKIKKQCAYRKKK